MVVAYRRTLLILREIRSENSLIFGEHFATHGEKVVQVDLDVLWL